MGNEQRQPTKLRDIFPNGEIPYEAANRLRKVLLAHEEAREEADEEAREEADEEAREEADEEAREEAEEELSDELDCGAICSAQADERRQELYEKYFAEAYEKYFAEAYEKYFAEAYQRLLGTAQQDR